PASVSWFLIPSGMGPFGCEPGLPSTKSTVRPASVPTIPVCVERVSSGVSGYCLQYGSQGLPLHTVGGASPNARRDEVNDRVECPSSTQSPHWPPVQTLWP